MLFRSRINLYLLQKFSYSNNCLDPSDCFAVRVGKKFETCEDEWQLEELYGDANLSDIFIARWIETSVLFSKTVHFVTTNVDRVLG